MINTRGQQIDASQEPLFPSTPDERQQMQEHHLDLLIEIAQASKEAKDHAQRFRNNIQSLKLQAAKLEEFLRASRIRK